MVDQATKNYADNLNGYLSVAGCDCTSNQLLVTRNFQIAYNNGVIRGTNRGPFLSKDGIYDRRTYQALSEAFEGTGATLTLPCYGIGEKCEFVSTIQEPLSQSILPTPVDISLSTNGPGNSVPSASLPPGGTYVPVSNPPKTTISTEMNFAPIAATITGLAVGVGVWYYMKQNSSPRMIRRGSRI